MQQAWTLIHGWRSCSSGWFVWLMGSECALRLGPGVFLNWRKVPGPVCVPFSVKCVTYFVSCYRQIVQDTTSGWRRGFNLTMVSFGAVCSARGWELVWHGFCYFLPLWRSRSNLLIPFKLWPRNCSVLQEAVIAGLHSETTYSVTVAAYTTKGDGARSKAKVITTTGAGQGCFYQGYHVKHRICAICLLWIRWYYL